MAADPYAEQRDRQVKTLIPALAAVYAAAKADVLRQVGTGVVRGALRPIWSERLRVVVAEQSKRIAGLFGASIVHDLDGQLADFQSSMMSAYLDVFADAFSTAWEAETQRALDSIDLAAADLVAEANAVMVDVEAAAQVDAETITQRSSNFGLNEGGKTVGSTVKVWITGDNPRETHASLNGEAVPIGARFTNGLRYPGAPGPPAEVVNCNCSMIVRRAA